MDGILGSSSCRRKVSGLGGLAKRTLLEGALLGLGVPGIFLFRALDRLKIGVGEAGEKFLIGAAGVLVTSGPEPPGIRLSAIVSVVDDIRVVLPDAVVLGSAWALMPASRSPPGCSLKWSCWSSSSA